VVEQDHPLSSRDSPAHRALSLHYHAIMLRLPCRCKIAETADRRRCLYPVPEDGGDNLTLGYEAAAIYTHVDEGSCRDALSRLDQVLRPAPGRAGSAAAVITARHGTVVKLQPQRRDLRYALQACQLRCSVAVKPPR